MRVIVLNRDAYLIKQSLWLVVTSPFGLTSLKTLIVSAYDNKNLSQKQLLSF